MNFLTANVFGAHTYRGKSEVNFFLDDNDALAVTIDTDRLHIRSVEASEQDYDSYADLFGSHDVMCKYANGLTKNKDEIQARVRDVWVKRWNEKDPFSGLAIFKKDEDEFIRHVVIGHGDVAGQSELAYLLMKRHWGAGFGTEVVTAVVQEYAPAIISEGYNLDGKPLEKITATARPDNPASVKILEKIGMRKIGEEEKFGALRHHFSLDLTIKV